jgi:ABC-type nickel/cobalt efflux system permease component RcnA
MTKHNHEHSGAEKHKHQHKEKTGIRNLHKDWRTWVAVGLMLAAIAIYVLTLDDSVVPVVQTGNQGQTATTPP